jgi:hypothetical protein
MHLCVREDFMREDRCPQLSVPIDAELKARLEAAAAREDRPVASFVRRIVLKALDGEREGAAAEHPSAGRRSTGWNKLT